MEQTVILKIIISFLIAGTWITIATVLAEKFGSKIGGLITNLPSNILISMIFIALIHGNDHIIKIVPGIPFGMIIDSFFLLILVFLLKYNKWIAIGTSLLFWFVLAFVFNELKPQISLWLSSVIYLIITIACFLFAERRMKIPSKQKNPKKYSVNQLLVRAIFAGGIVAIIVLISNYAQPFWVGMFSTFPAVLLSSMVILIINQGKDFARATGKVLIISTSNILVYALGIYFLYPILGLVFGTILSFIFAVLWVWLIVPFLKNIS